ncbi:MAG: rubrerythrin, partial [Verrucomicrobia bacterium]|nr:rubrerythrin [Verrucomicrobiota bacterium]
MIKAFNELKENEVLALAISLEEEDGRIYGEFAERVKADYPATASIL